MTTPSRWPLIGFYATYFAVVGVWIPYWPLHLTSLGVTPQTIGLLTALTQWMRIPAPPGWGYVADRGSRYNVVVLTCTGSLVSFGLFFLDTRLDWILGVTILYSLFHAGPLALTDATAMELSVKHHWDYGQLRLWGSWGFILCSLGLGPISDQLGLQTIPMVILLLLLANLLCALRLPRTPNHAGQHTSIRTLFARADVKWFYFSATLMQFSHGGYYGFMSLHLQQHGFSRTLIGLLWAVGVVAEVVLMSRSRTLLDRVGVTRLLTFSLLLAAVRWSVYATTTEWIWLGAAQLLHAFTFGAFHVASIRRVHDLAPIQARGTAQGWLGALSYGLGGGVSMALSGLVLERFGHETMFAMLALAALFGTLASWRAATLFARTGIAP
ncbi:MAG: MFS transporter [Magnetococcales bacterium]|nr:MFS transporter [Magnetococcales bacterium]